MLHGLLNAQWITLHGLIALLGVAFFVIASRVRGQRRHPSAAMAWVISLALMPYVALPLYVLIGNRKVRRNRAAAPAWQAAIGRADTPAARFERLALAMGLPSPAAYEQLSIHDNGAVAWQSLQDIMQGAKRTLDVSSFLLGRDALGDAIIAIMLERAAAGVRVRFLIDGIGRYLGGRPDLRRLSDAGVSVAVFVSPFRSALPGRTNLRNHRKLVVADAERTWSGGRNLATEYFLGDPQARPAAPAWIDLSFDFQGDLARQAQDRFSEDWAFATDQPAPPATAPTAPPQQASAHLAQTIASGPDQADDTFYALLVSSCFTAAQRILAVTPYFVPDALLMMGLTLAARRGVAVDLVLPLRSNHLLADWARGAALRDLIAAGGHVWFVNNMVHAKLVLIDDDLALAGSANLDDRSLFLNYELMFAFNEKADVQRFAQWAEALRGTATPYPAQPPGIPRQLAEGLVRWLAFQL